MGAGFTPGPWFVHDIASSSVYIGPAGGAPSVAIALTKVNVPAGETMANARLIAAAPELLNALRLIEHATSQAPDDEGFHEAAHDIARAAIAKATGEQP